MTPKFYAFYTDGGLTVPADRMGLIPTRQEWAEIAAGVAAFYEAASAAEILSANEANLQSQKAPQPKGPQRSRPGYVYVLEGGGLYKIGMTSAPASREKIIGVQLPFPTKIAVLQFVDNPRATEQALHRQFASRRKNGEWFDLTPSDLTGIRQRLGISA